MIDYAACHVVYLDKRVKDDRFESRNGTRPSSSSIPNNMNHGGTEYVEPDIKQNLKTLMAVFQEVHVCNSGLACLRKTRELDSVTLSYTPTLVFVEVVANEGEDSSSLMSKRGSERLSSSTTQVSNYDRRSRNERSPASEDFYGLTLLKHIASEVNHSNLSKLVVAIALVREGSSAHMPAGLGSPEQNQLLGVEPPPQGKQDLKTARILRCLEAGATDVVLGILTPERVKALTIHAYHAHVKAAKERPVFLDEKRMRKRSWVGVDEEKPYAYLRESMVSTLMESICKPQNAMVKVPRASLFFIEPDREQEIQEAIGMWAFCTHDFTDDELLHAAFLMLQHALSMPELEQWRIPPDELKSFLSACRSAYNSFVLYHNFRHVVDVLQAVFFFLLQLRILPPHPSYSTGHVADVPLSPIAALLKPFDAFVLLVSAIGHDVGHPGVNNAFLVALKAPLAQLYNDISVLEAFHCAAYSQILRRYWNVAFEDTEVRRLLIKSILATDMQVHFKYMTDLGNLQEKLHHNQGTDGWSIQQLEEYKILACGLLIKCADISNVARPFSIAAKWSDILQQEFARQGEMERNVGIPTTLFGGPPELGNMTKLANSQIGFMNIFAYPLFEAVSDILPGMQFGVDEIKSNQGVWKGKIEEEKSKQVPMAEGSGNHLGFQSPRSGSPERTFASDSLQAFHPEGLPATGSPLPPPPATEPLSTSTESPRVQANSAPFAQVGEAISTPDRTAHSSPHLSNMMSGPMIHSSPFSDTVDSSRRSSGVYPVANISKGFSSRRSSNTVPTQLQLGLTSATLANSHSENSAPARPTTSTFYDTNSSPSSVPRTRSDSGGGISASVTTTYSTRDKRTDSESSFSQPPSQGQQAPPTATFYGNFSRPMSTRHSAHPSYARSSAPSGTPTFASNILPNSPADTQATSFLTEGSDVGGISAPESMEIDRPGTGYSSGLGTSTISSVGGSRSPGGTRSPANRELVKPAVTPTSAGRGGGMNGHAEGERVLRKKGSRFRFDFWKKKKAGELSP